MSKNGLPSLESLLIGVESPAVIDYVTTAYNYIDMLVINGKIQPDDAVKMLASELISTLKK